MKITITSQKLLTIVADAHVIFTTISFDPQELLEPLFAQAFPALKKLIVQRNFTGKLGQVFSAPISDNSKNYVLILVGLGSGDKKISLESYRRGLGRIVRTAEQLRLTSLAVQLPESSVFGSDDEFLAEQTATIFKMAQYHYDTLITDSDRKIVNINTIELSAAEERHKMLNRGISTGLIIGSAVNTARVWVDTPPSLLPPKELALEAKKIAQKHDLKLTIFTEPDIIKMGMGGLASVSRGSEQDCQLVIMEYTPSTKKTGSKKIPTLALVGKGITFDSGGLSLKPASSMETMKEDMSGAAAVISAMNAIAQLKPACNVIAVTPISENMPSGSATKPGDVARFYNGKTAEIRNTDAEGRLILADALSYTVKHYTPDAIIDLATLTGACSYALGPFFSGLMSPAGSEKFAQAVITAAERSGDAVWQLPLNADYGAAIRSSIADICNMGNPKYRAGATTAACFLQNFVGNTPWVHLDIAGTAFDVPDISYYRSGATGVGVRLLIELVRSYN